MAEITKAQTFFAEIRVGCFILFLRALLRICNVRYFVRNCGLLCQCKQQGKGKINEVAAQHGQYCIRLKTHQ